MEFFKVTCLEGMQLNTRVNTTIVRKLESPGVRQVVPGDIKEN